MYLAILGTILSLLGGERIVGGHEAIHKQRSAVGSLYYNKQAPGNEGHFCAATLIAPRWALTAAHCLEGVRAGRIDVVFARDDLRFSTGTRRGISAIHIYPGYRSKPSSWDLGLVYLGKPVGIRPMRLRFTRPRPGEKLTILGWGQTGFHQETSQQLRQTWVRAKSSTSCKKIYNFLDIRESFCASSPNRDICFGDSGGPALDRRSRLAGVISRGARCGNKKYPGLYSKLDFARSWIKKTRVRQAQLSRAPAPEVAYNPLLVAPYKEFSQSSFAFYIDSREAIKSGRVQFAPRTNFCSLEGVCKSAWIMQEIKGPHQETRVLYGKSPDRCLRFSWQITFTDHRLQAKRGKTGICREDDA